MAHSARRMTYNTHLIPLTIVALLSGPASGAAQAPPPPGRQEAEQKDLTFADEITVTADRLEHRVADVPATVTVLTRDDIRRSSAQSVDELLRQVPGFNLLRQGSSIAGHPTVRAASMRGLGGSANSRALVLVDGVPINDPFSGAVFWTRIPLDNIERVEIVTGGTSIVWGNLALAGVINIITIKPSERSVTITAEGGTRDTRKIHLAARGARGPVRAGIAASYFDTGGYHVIRKDQLGPIDRSVTDIYRTLDGTFEYQASPTALWSFGGSLYSENQGYGTALSTDAVHTGYVRGGGDFTTRGSNRWQVTTFVTRQNATSLFPSVGAGRLTETPASNQFDMPAMEGGASLLWSRPMSARHLLAAGADVRWVQATANEDFNFVAASRQLTRRRKAGGHQAFNGVYVQDVFRVTNSSQIVGAIRIDRWETSDGSRRESDLLTGNVLREETYADQTAWTVNPSLGVRHDLTSRVSVKASVYRAFRVPMPSELYRPFRSRGNVITESNAQLTPERLTGFEAGSDLTFGPRVRARAVGFWNRLDDPVVTITVADAGSVGREIQPCGFVAAGGTCRQRQNLGRLRSRGIDSELEYRPKDEWILSAGYEFVQSTVLAAPQPALVGKANRHTPEHQLVLGASYDDPRFISVSALARYVSSRFDDDLNTLPIAGFMTADLRISRALLPRADVFVSIQNLFNRTYEITRSEDGTVGIGAPRLVNAGLRWRF
ncbi:MAG: TonB-dependent receptor [Vicinamibacterales bacterium]